MRQIKIRVNHKTDSIFHNQPQKSSGVKTVNMWRGKKFKTYRNIKRRPLQ